MTILERIEYLQKVWRTMLPHIIAPAAEDVARWCNYPDAAVEQAIFRTGKKFAATKINQSFNPLQAYRYVTGTAKVMAAATAPSSTNPQREVHES